MANYIFKKDTYEVREQLSSFIYKVAKDEKDYIVFDFKDNPEGFSDFKFAQKRLRNSGIQIPNLVALDKKNRFAILEYVDGPTGLDLLDKGDIEDIVFEQLFALNYKARINNMRLDFHPHKFRFFNNKLYYLPFTFTAYIRKEDFTEKELNLWFYSKTGTDNLLAHGYAINKNRIGSEFETNKKMVLTVVKYFR